MRVAAKATEPVLRTLYFSSLDADYIDIKILVNRGLLSHKAIHSV